MDQHANHAIGQAIRAGIVACLACGLVGCSAILVDPTATITSAPSSQLEYVGRVVAENTGEAIQGAEVAFEFEGAPPVVYTDSEGIYRFTLSFKGDRLSGRVRVEADGYETYDRNITLLAGTPAIEEIHLEPSESASDDPPSSPTNASLAPSPTATFRPSPEPGQSTGTSAPKQTQSTPGPTAHPSTLTPEPPGGDTDLKSLGEGYSSNGISLTLRQYEIGSSNIELEFVVKNESSSQAIIRYQNSYVELYDDTGREYDHAVSCEYDTKQQQFEPGDTEELDDGYGCYFGGIGDFQGVISEGASYLIVKVSEFMDLKDMQWRIDLAPPANSEQSPPPGQMLPVGQGFSANGLTLILSDYSIGDSDIAVKFVVKNESNGSVLVHYRNSYVQMYDDLGSQYERDAACMEDLTQQHFAPGETEELDDGYGCYFGGIGDFQGVISEGASYLIVKVSEFMDLKDMQWRIDLAPPANSEQSPPPGQMLPVGQGFSANGLTLILSDYSIGDSDIAVKFVVKNESSGSVLVHYRNSYIQMYDDVGNQYERDAACMEDLTQQHFAPGETEELDDGYGCYFGGIGDFQGVISEGASYLIVRISEFMDLTDMQWRIDL